MKRSLPILAMLAAVVISPIVAVGETAVDTVSAASLVPHNPYDQSNAAPVDSADVYRSGGFSLWEMPRALWTVAVHPLGQFAIYAEHTKLVSRYYRFFTNRLGTFGVFPQLQLGGETGTGGGVRVFHTNVGGMGNQFEAVFIYSGGTGRMGEALYVNPNILASGLLWEVEAEYLRTRRDDATINGAFLDDDGRLRLEQVDVATSLGWRSASGPLAPYRNGVEVDGWLGYGSRQLQRIEGIAASQDGPGMTPQARLIKGVGQRISLARVGGRVAYDDRDYKPPVRSISHPLNYHFPGRILSYSDGLYHSHRDLGYPERGGILSAEGELFSGSKGVRFYRISAEIQRFVTLFWRDRILAVRVRAEKVRSVGDGRWIPYTDLLTLGGNTSTRGYERGYFRGQGALLVSAEYRYPIWDTWNAFVFLDESNIFDHFADIDSEGFRSSYGGGISLRTEYGLLGKVQIAHSAEKAALIGFTFEQDF